MEIQLVSGNYFRFDDPDGSPFGIEDIAHALAHLCRFTGHTKTFYSVAQHCVLVSHLVPPGDALQGLLHDGAEAFLGDVASPLKALLPDYRAIERRVERAVFRRFGLPETLPGTVRRADQVALATERRDLMVTGSAHDRHWARVAGTPAHAQRIQPWSSAAARAAFLDRFEAVSGRVVRHHLCDAAPRHAPGTGVPR